MAVELEALRTFQPRSMNVFACALAVRRGEFLRGDIAMRQQFGGGAGVQMASIKHWMHVIEEWHTLRSDELPAALVAPMRFALLTPSHPLDRFSRAR